MRRSVALTFTLAVLACGARSEPSEIAPIDGGADPICTSCGDCDEHFSVGSAVHVRGDLMYDENPPVGGNHNPLWANWGVHDVPVADQCFVHNMEHGGVIFLYDCPDGCAAEVAKLEAFVGDHARTLLTPYSELPARFAATAWGHRLVSDCLDMAAFTQFYQAAFNQGPESVGGNPPSECH
jgi:hypothetical protein